jgi:hypothetical protein
LKESDIVRLDWRELETMETPQRQRAAKAHGLWQIPRRNRVSDVTQREIGQRPAQAAQEVAAPVTTMARTAVPSIAFSSVWAKFSRTTIASAPESSS